MATRRQRRQTRRLCMGCGEDPWQHNLRVRVQKLMRQDIKRMLQQQQQQQPVRLTPSFDELHLGLPYWDRRGRRVSRQQFIEYFEDMSYRQIALDHVKDAVVSTVWLGIDHAFGMSTHPVIFETMVFGGDDDGRCERYTSEDAARCGHMEVIETLLERVGGGQ